MRSFLYILVLSSFCCWKMESDAPVVRCAELQRWSETYTPGYAQMTEDAMSAVRKSPFTYDPKINEKIAYWLVVVIVSSLIKAWRNISVNEPGWCRPLTSTPQDCGTVDWFVGWRTTLSAHKGAMVYIWCHAKIKSLLTVVHHLDLLLHWCHVYMFSVNIVPLQFWACYSRALFCNQYSCFGSRTRTTRSFLQWTCLCIQNCAFGLDLGLDNLDYVAGSEWRLSSVCSDVMVVLQMMVFASRQLCWFNTEPRFLVSVLFLRWKVLLSSWF